ncbi:MAG: cytochrome P450 [Terrimicrobiaceae bacterium]
MSKKSYITDDPFKEARARCPMMVGDFQDGEKIPMLLKLRDVREAAKDWKTFSSDAPRRIPIPSEEALRDVRQYPIELDPPEHGEYRKLVEPFFLRPKLPEVRAKIEGLIGCLLQRMIARDSFEAVHDFAIPLQSYALAYLLNVPESEGEKWIAWGVHVTRAGDGKSKGSEMEDYNRKMFQEAKAQPGDDFYSALNVAKIHGRLLTDEEKEGFAYLAFAGGRDTIIHTLTGIMAYFAKNPEDMARLREHPEAVNLAAEEFFRLAIPLTHIGRVCPAKTNVHGYEVEPGGRISLTWAAANRDPEAFQNPNDVDLQRKPNPHVAFGFGHHNCLGSHHARAIIRSFLTQLPRMVAGIRVLEEVPCMEVEKDYTRQIGFNTLVLAFEAT